MSFNIDNGELRAIIGPNGAGKTTFMDIITGKTRPDSGDVIWGEKNISLIRKSESEIANLGVGRKFQKPTIFEDQSVMENLIMALKNKRSPLSVLFYKYNKIDHNKVVNIASDIGLISVLDKLSGELSHGQKQWLEIGMLLAQEPQLLLIDEPAAGMTLEERKHTVLLLKRLSKTRAVVVVEHDMEFIRNLSCKVTVLHEGAVLAEGTLDHVVKNKTVIDVYLGR